MHVSRSAAPVLGRAGIISSSNFLPSRSLFRASSSPPVCRTPSLRGYSTLKRASWSNSLLGPPRSNQERSLHTSSCRCSSSSSSKNAPQTTTTTTMASGKQGEITEPMLTTAFPELAPLVLPETSKALTTLLDDNHAKHHCFFNTRGMHNHSAHQLIADLTLGATPSQLSSHYHYQIQHYLGEFSLNDRRKYDPYVAESTTKGMDRGGRPIVKIDASNWVEHLGNARYYWSYLHFFDELLAMEGMEVGEVLERFVFSGEANRDGRAMVVRFYGGVLHSLIHVGYGLELGRKGLVAEGLAMATATSASHAWLFDIDWLKSVSSGTGDGKRGLLELVKEIQQDERLSVESLRLKEQESSLADEPFEQPGSPGYGLIRQYVDRWSAIHGAKVDEDQAGLELALLSALLLGAVPKNSRGSSVENTTTTIAAAAGREAYKHDFFLMHLNNSHLFTPLFLDLFKHQLSVGRGEPSLAGAFLRGLAAQFLYYYICRGRPSFTWTNYLDEQQQARTRTRTGSGSELEWNAMFAEARQNVDEHLPKAVRALYVYHLRYGGLSGRLIERSGLLGTAGSGEAKSTSSAEEAGEGEMDVFKLTAQQLVRMHRGELQASRYDDNEEAQRKGERRGAHQEFWSFEPFF